MFEELVEALLTQAQRVSCEQARLLTCIRAVAKAAPVPEFAADEVAFALTWTRKAAEAQVALANQLLDHMPEVFAALGTGVIDLPKARVFAEVLQPLDPAVAREVAAQVLPVAGEKTTAQIRERLHRRALAADPSSAAKRRERAVADRRITLESWSDGTATLTALGLPAQRAMAAFERVNAIAKARKLAGEELSMDRLRADTMLDLLEGVGVGAIPGVRRGAIELTVGLDTLAGLNDRPAMLGGYGSVGADVARHARSRDWTVSGASAWCTLPRASCCSRASPAPAQTRPRHPAATGLTHQTRVSGGTTVPRRVTAGLGQARASGGTTVPCRVTAGLSHGRQCRTRRIGLRTRP